MPRESKQARLSRMHQEYAVLCEEIPHPKCALNFSNPFELLVATVLSAANHRQTREYGHTGIIRRISGTGRTCERQSRTRGKHHSFHRISSYEGKEHHRTFLRLVRTVDRRGAANHGCFDKSARVGRKTANVVLGNAFGVPGFPVDTHVIRVTGRLRWRSDWASGSPDPKAIEREITACFPPEEWTDLSHRLILHGRAICHARKPDCLNCPLNDTCPSAFAA